MTFTELLDHLRQGERAIDTRGAFIAAAGPYLTPSLAGVPGPVLDEAIVRFGLERCDGTLGLPGWRLPQAGHHPVAATPDSR